MPLALLIVFALALQTDAYNGIGLGGALTALELGDLADMYHFLPGHGDQDVEDVYGEESDLLKDIVEYLPLAESYEQSYPDTGYEEQGAASFSNIIDTIINELQLNSHRERRNAGLYATDSSDWNDLEEQIGSFIDNSLSEIDPSLTSAERTTYGFFDKLKEQQVCAKVQPQVCEFLKPMLPCLSIADLMSIRQAMQANTTVLLELMLTDEMYEILTSQDTCLTEKQRNAFSKLLEHRDTVLQFAPCFNASLVPELKAALDKGLEAIVDLALSDRVYDMLSPCMGDQGRHVYEQLMNHKEMVVDLVPCLNVSMLPDLTSAMQEGLPGIINYTLSKSTISMLSPCLKQRMKDLLLKLLPKKPMLMEITICFTCKVWKAFGDAYKEGGMVAVLNLTLTQDMYEQISPCLKNDTREMYERLLENRDLVMQVAPCLNLTVLQEFKEQLNGGKLDAVMALLTPQFYEMLSPCLANCTRDVYRLALDVRNKKSYAIKGTHRPRFLREINSGWGMNVRLNEMALGHE